MKNFLIKALILLVSLAIVGIQVAAISRGLFGGREKRTKTEERQ